MDALPPPAQRRVQLRLASGESQLNAMPAEALETLLARAHALGIPLHHDAQIAGVLASLRLRDDVPTLLYAAAASVLAAVYDASQE